jgi:ubiquinol-cytochrome c reductase cytochrome b subunit
MPVFAAKAGAFLAVVAGVCVAMSGLFQINPVWSLGPCNPGQVSAQSVPDCYMMLADGLLLLYPWIQRRMTKDTAHHNLLHRPRDVPVRTSLGVMALTAHMVLTLSSVNDTIAATFDVSLNATAWAGRIGLHVLPLIVYAIGYRTCLGSQRSDREVLEHGVETGIIRREPIGG